MLYSLRGSDLESAPRGPLAVTHPQHGRGGTTDSLEIRTRDPHRDPDDDDGALRKTDGSSIPRRPQGAARIQERTSERF